MLVSLTKACELHALHEAGVVRIVHETVHPNLHRITIELVQEEKNIEQQAQGK